MARARNIKPAFFTNEDLIELDFGVRLLFIGLWTIADREGRLEDRPKKIKMELFPADDINVNDALSGLEKYGFIKRYTVNNVNVIQVTNFVKHQSPHGTEKDSVLPDFNGDITVNERSKNGVITGKTTKEGNKKQSDNDELTNDNDSLTLDNVNPLLDNALNHESRIMNHESRIMNHESRIMNHESRIMNPDLLIVDVMNQCENSEKPNLSSETANKIQTDSERIKSEQDKVNELLEHLDKQLVENGFTNKTAKPVAMAKLQLADKMREYGLSDDDYKRAVESMCADEWYQENKRVPSLNHLLKSPESVTACLNNFEKNMAAKRKRETNAKRKQEQKEQQQQQKTNVDDNNVEKNLEAIRLLKEKLGA